MDLFSENMVVPTNLRFFLHRLSENSQVSTNILKINAMNSTSASSGGLITVRLPMALIDLNSFAMFFQTTTTDGASTSGVATGILPKGIESIVSRLEISVNGLGLLNLQQYNLLYSILKDSHQDSDKAMMRRVLQNEVDTSPLLISSAVGTAGNTPLTSQTIFVSGINSITAVTMTGGTPALTNGIAIKATCGALYPNIQIGQRVGGIPLANLGIVFSGTYGTTLVGTVTSVASVPSYIQSVSLNGSTNYVTGDLVTQLTITYAYTSSVFTYTAPTTWPSTDPKYSFSAFVGGTIQTGYSTSTGNSSTTASQVVPPFASVLTAQGTAGAPNTSYPYYQANQNSFHCISDWLSFFKAAPNWLQSQMIGEIEIRITLADNTILAVPPDFALTTRPDYNLSNIYFTIRSCSFDSNFYDEILSEKLSGGGEVEISYPNYYNINQVQSSGASSTRFSVNTQCLNKVISVNRPSYYNSTLGAMIHVPCGYGVKADGSFGLVKKGAYFQTYSATAPFTSSAVTSVNNWQYQLNNNFIPNIKTDPSFTYYNTLEAWNLHNDWLSSTISGNPNLFLNSCYQMSIALDFMDSTIPRLMSGIDTRGAVSVAYLLQDNNNANDRTDIFTAFTSILKIGANQQIQVIY